MPSQLMHTATAVSVSGAQGPMAAATVGWLRSRIVSARWSYNLDRITLFSTFSVLLLNLFFSFVAIVEFPIWNAANLAI